MTASQLIGKAIIEMKATGLSLDEIATVLDLSKSTVCTRLAEYRKMYAVTERSKSGPKPETPKTFRKPLNLHGLPQITITLRPDTSVDAIALMVAYLADIHGDSVLHVGMPKDWLNRVEAQREVETV